ncbi:MAG TPA: hypothetical protein VK789_13935 [Bryobacteraceae bacterium]|nr:hypothetical protein [Bryobacteraceae bacterium]
MFRLIRSEGALTVDFMTGIHGMRSFDGLRSRAAEVDVEGAKLAVAALADIIASKKAANRPQDRGALNVLEEALRKTESTQGPEGGKQAKPR